jgi:competence protein ComEC
MQNWVPYAMVRLAAFLIGGILLAIYLPNSIDQQVSRFALILLTVLYFLFRLLLRRKRVFRIACGLTGFAAVFLFGFIHLQAKTDARRSDHILSISAPIQVYEAIVRSAPESKAKTWRVLVDLEKVKTDSWSKANGKVFLYISKNSMPAIPWSYGDRLLIRGAPQGLAQPANPNEFNYKRYLGFRNIHHQQFLEADQIHYLKSVDRKGFIYYSHRVRAWATRVITRTVVGEQEQAIAMALILGVTEGIDTDLQNAYAASGAMHVLAVSGLHVGIIYGIILLLLKPLNAFSWSRWVIAGISILLLWIFAFVTGLSPSVLRAVTMFSFIAFARPLGWRTNIYNTLAASAFVLLIYNPYLIMSVGFQLSYLAVLGIVYLQRPIYNLWEIQNRVGDWIWQITCVSLAAQMATFALSMLYFHQFPVYFLVSNLFVIPLSTLVLMGGILLLIVSALAPLAAAVGYGLQLLIQLLNWLVFKAEALPFSLINDIYITTFQCWVIMGLLLMLLLMFHFRSIRFLYAGVAISVVLMYTQWQHYQQTMNENQFVVYSVSGHSAIEWIRRGVSYFNADTALVANEERMRFHIRPNRLQHSVNIVHTQIPFKRVVADGFTLYRWQDTHIAVVDKKNKLPEVANFGYLVISRNSVTDPKHLSTFGLKQIILDGSNSRNYVQRWQAWASEYSLPVHAVVNQGAFVLMK